MPRHRIGAGRAASGTADTGVVVRKNSIAQSRNDNKWKIFRKHAGSRIGRTRIRLAVGLLVAIAFASLLCSDFALESTNLDVSATLSKEQAGQINATNHLADPSTRLATNLSASESDDVSTAAPSLSSEMANQSSVKYQWDGGSPDSYMYKAPGFPHSFPVYRTSPDRNQLEAFHGNVVQREQEGKKLFRKRDEQFQRMNSTLELLPCRLDEVNGCLQEKTAVDIESSKAADPGGPVMLLYNPLDEGRAFEIVGCECCFVD